jgi:hypothetical protein
VSATANYLGADGAGLAIGLQDAGSTISGTVSGDLASGVTITLSGAGSETATANSYLNKVTISSISSVDAQNGVAITVGAVSGVSITSPYTLPSGGKLVVK